MFLDASVPHIKQTAYRKKVFCVASLFLLVMDPLLRQLQASGLGLSITKCEVVAFSRNQRAANPSSTMGGVLPTKGVGKCPGYWWQRSVGHAFHSGKQKESHVREISCFMVTGPGNLGPLSHMVLVITQFHSQRAAYDSTTEIVSHGQPLAPRFSYCAKLLERVW